MAILITISILSNAYLARDVFQKLFYPKKIIELADFSDINFDGKRILLISDANYLSFSQKEQELSAELNQVLYSKYAQLKRVSSSELNNVYLGDFDFILAFSDKYNPEGFKLKEKYAGGRIWLYRNSQFFSGQIFSFNSLVRTENIRNIDRRLEFFSDLYSTNPRFILDDSESNVSDKGLARIIDVFGEVEAGDINENKTIDKQISGVADDNSNRLFESDQQGNFNEKEVKVSDGFVDVSFADPSYDYKNIVSNPSFEDGGWQEEVGDCNNYDDFGDIKMRIVREGRREGDRSVQLEAARHIACTSQKIPIKGGNQYIFSFDYQGFSAKNAGYFLGFNDEEKTTVRERLPINDKDWHNFSKKIVAPESATNVSLYIYSYATDNRTNNIVRYDNFKLINIPDLEDRFYFVSSPKEKLEQPAEVKYEIINPTKKLVHIKGARTAFFLGMSESYHKDWKLESNNGKIQGIFSSWSPLADPDFIQDDRHYKLNNFLNAWYVEPEALCIKNSACRMNPDGSYDLEMVIEFWPQRWFYLGLWISSLTFLGCLTYLSYPWIKKRIVRQKEARIIKFF